MRILWVSNSPFAPSGYGQQTALTTKMLRDLGHEVHIFANYRQEGDVSGTFDGDIPVYDSGYPRSDSYRGLGAHVLALRPQLVVVLADAWTLTYDRVAKEFMFFPTDTKFALYSPVDSDVLSPREIPVYENADVVLAMSFHAYEAIQDAGFTNLFYVPHSVDASVFSIHQYHRHNIIGMVHANYGTRKLIPIQLEALSLLKGMTATPSFQVLFHCDIRNELQRDYATDYSPLIKQLGLEDYILQTWMPDRVALPDDLCRLYNRCKVLLHTTAGEGFGIPVVEAALCGTPAVVTANSAPQHFRWASKVKPVVKEYTSHLLARHSWPRPEDVAEALLNHLRSGLDPGAVRDAALRFSSHVVRDDCWVPFLEAVEHGFEPTSSPEKNYSTA